MSDQHRQDYCAPWQVALRDAPGEGLCSDEDCDLSGGYAHVGECMPCDCGKRHAIDECPVGRGVALTPSEIALAKIVAAIAVWAPQPPDRKQSPGAHKATLNVALALPEYVADEGAPTDAGRALLDRARKAGAL